MAHALRRALADSTLIQGQRVPSAMVLVTHAIPQAMRVLAFHAQIPISSKAGCVLRPVLLDIMATQSLGTVNNVTQNATDVMPTGPVLGATQAISILEEIVCMP